MWKTCLRLMGTQEVPLTKAIKHGRALKSQCNIYSKGLAQCNIHSEGLVRCNIYSKGLAQCNIHSEGLVQCNIHSKELAQCNFHSKGLAQCNIHSKGLAQCNIHSKGLAIYYFLTARNKMAVSNASTKYQTKLRKVKARGYPTLLSLYKKIRNKFDAVFTQLQTGTKL